VPDERVVQRRALLQRLGLSTSHYLKLQEPQGPGQAAQVDLEPLLNTAAICLMPDQLTYHWWQAPAAAKQLTPDDNPLATGTRPATQPNAVDIHAGSQAVPGLIEVKASAGIAHAERRVDCLPAKRGLPSPVAFSETAASVSAQHQQQAPLLHLHLNPARAQQLMYQSATVMMAAHLAVVQCMYRSKC